ncbi:hypothetical protein [Kribbella sp. NPDC051770]|uniref:hypothetical protein n=1 Tax=Kribbella sp. NPDC051770 TaxID=3155413 RepID=UPI0034301BAC
MRALKTIATVLGTVALTGVAVTASAAPTPTEAAPASTQAAPGCIGASFSEKRALNSGEAICKGDFLVRMQPNGDLVLRVISTGRACWASHTSAAGASATFHGGNIQAGLRPYVQIGSTRVGGDYNLGDPGTNANVNSKGEFWIAYAKRGWC